jgi:hypothetical protein
MRSEEWRSDVIVRAYLDPELSPGFELWRIAGLRFKIDPDMLYNSSTAVIYKANGKSAGTS